MWERAPRRHRISPAALSLFQQCLQDTSTSGNLDGLMSLEPFPKIAGTAYDRSSAFKTREALLVEILFAAVLAAPWRDDLGYRRVAIVHNDRAARADVIEIARKAVTQLRDFGFLHGLSIIASWRCRATALLRMR